MKASLIVTGAKMPAGTYVVGDPCYAVPGDRWMDFLAAADPDVFGPGATSLDVKKVLLADLDGHPILGIGTAYGDGVYRGSDGNRYGVDAGMIGLVPVEFAEGDSVERGHSSLVEFGSDFECRYENGVIVLGHIRIDTEGADEDDADGSWADELDTEEDDDDGEDD